MIRQGLVNGKICEGRREKKVKGGRGGGERKEGWKGRG